MAIYGNNRTRIGGRYANYGSYNDIGMHHDITAILRKNGLDAYMEMNQQGKATLVVQGRNDNTTYHVFRYNLTNEQMAALMQGGTDYKNKKAYETFNRIVARDFGTPENFVIAKEVGVTRDGSWNRRTMVNMGWNGVGYRGPWNSTVYAPERHDGRRLPGESAETRLTADGIYRPTAGYYYRGNSMQRVQEQKEVLQTMTAEVQLKPLKPAERPEGMATPLSEKMWANSDLYAFDLKEWKDVLAEHGIIIHEKMTDKKGVAHTGVEIRAKNLRANVFYDLTPEEMAKLTAPSLKGENGVTIDERLSVINSHKDFARDFSTPITKEMLESKDYIDITATPEAKAEIEKDYIRQDRLIAEQQRRNEARQRLADAISREQQRLTREDQRITNDPQAVNGRNIAAIIPGKGWFAEQAHGRAIVVGEIRVDKRDGQSWMSVMLNGEWHTLPISEKTFEKFLNVDDKHRLMLCEKTFDSLKIDDDKEIRRQPLARLAADGTVITKEQDDIRKATSNNVDGATLAQLNERKGFYREGRNGREVEVRDIQVQQHEGQYKMTAVIDGQTYTHDLSQKEYNRFMAVDDYQRMKMFSKIFKEADMKTRPEYKLSLGDILKGGLIIATEGACLAAETAATIHDIKHALDRPPHGRPAPDIYVEGYHKEGVTNPYLLAETGFQERMLMTEQEQTQGAGIRRGT